MNRIFASTRLKAQFIRHSTLPCFYSTTREKLKVLFFGTDDFAADHLRALVNYKSDPSSRIETIDLVCPPDRYTGRSRDTLTPSITKDVASFYDMDIFHPPEKATTLDDWHIPTTKQYDLGVVVSFGYFIPPHIISSFKYGAVNVHPSLLPKYRGAAPIQHSILYGDRETGVTIQELDDKEFDAGRILAQQSMTFRDVPSYTPVKEELSLMGTKMLVDTVHNLEDKKENASIQDSSKVTKAPKIRKELSEIDFTKMAAWQAEQLHRAIGPQYPLRVRLTFKRKKKTRYIWMQLLQVHIPKVPSAVLKGKEPGSFAFNASTDTLHIVFGDHKVLACSHLKAENKRAITANDFVNGYMYEGMFEKEELPEYLSKLNEAKIAKMKPFYRSYAE
ncbi:formyl transferase [Pilobolus umbonatus]|nr:formyl transferase [Pilobolus umbonatus]